jgi:hypothetical protein
MTDQHEAAGNNEPAAEGFMRIRTPRFHWPPGNCRGVVITGVSGFKSKTPSTEDSMRQDNTSSREEP